jgi:hypothetical protein
MGSEPKDFFDNTTKPKASDLKLWAQSQGWQVSQKTDGPLKYIDFI